MLASAFLAAAGTSSGGAPPRPADTSPVSPVTSTALRLVRREVRWLPATPGMRGFGGTVPGAGAGTGAWAVPGTSEIGAGNGGCAGTTCVGTTGCAGTAACAGSATFAPSTNPAVSCVTCASTPATDPAITTATTSQTECIRLTLIVSSPE